jgi:hypothetical protein
MNTLNKQIKDAIMDYCLVVIDNLNFGMFSQRRHNFNDLRKFKDNNIVVNYEKGEVLQNGLKIATIQKRYATRKTMGMYKQLKPVLTYL